MRKEEFFDQYKDPRWQKKRLKIMQRDKFTCKKCGDTKTQLHVHHKKYINSNSPWDYDNKLLITLCEDCHNSIEHIKKEKPGILFDQIKIFKATWNGTNNQNSKIIFISFPGDCLMRIFNHNVPDNIITSGYYLNAAIPKIIETLKHSNNG